MTLHYTPLRCITLHYTTFHYTSLHCTTLHSTTLNYNYNYTPLLSTTLIYTTINYTTLHYTALHYIPLHSTTLDCRISCFASCRGVPFLTLASSAVALAPAAPTQRKPWSLQPKSSKTTWKTTRSILLSSTLRCFPALQTHTIRTRRRLLPRDTVRSHPASVRHMPHKTLNKMLSPPPSSWSHRHAPSRRCDQQSCMRWSASNWSSQKIKVACWSSGCREANSSPRFAVLCFQAS